MRRNWRCARENSRRLNRMSRIANVARRCIVGDLSVHLSITTWEQSVLRTNRGCYKLIRTTSWNIKRIKAPRALAAAVCIRCHWWQKWIKTVLSVVRKTPANLSRVTTPSYRLLADFSRATLCDSAVLAVDRCPSVCPSHSCHIGCAEITHRRLTPEITPQTVTPRRGTPQLMCIPLR